jgi:hypothetical protein
MFLQKKVEPVLEQLINTLENLSDVSYNHKSILLNGSTIGGHTRHVIELFLTLLNGYEKCSINYEARKRDIQIETDKKFAISLLKNICTRIYLENKKLTINDFLNEVENDTNKIETNFNRELLYNLEHCVHHMALIRVAINEVSTILLPENFGVAAATIQYKKLCAQ